MEERARRGYASAAARGLIWFALGERERARVLLEQGCGERDWRLRDSKVNPLYDSLRDDPRFQALLKCAHLD
jgi:hypothetical protein